MSSRVPALMLVLCLSLSVWFIQRAGVPAYKGPSRSADATGCESRESVRNLVRRQQASSMSFQRADQGSTPAPAWLQDRLAQLSLSADKLSPGLDAKWRLDVLHASGLNAFAGASGEMAITRGMLKSSLDKDELTAVVAHEMAHIVHGHAVQRHCAEINSLDAAALYHKHEKEADLTARRILAGAGFPQTAVNGMLKKLSVVANRANKASGTHPSVAQRLAAIESENPR